MFAPASWHRDYRFGSISHSNRTVTRQLGSCFMSRTAIHIAFLIVIAISLVSSVRGQEADWKISLARVKITPPQPVHMAGYSARNKPYESVHDDLFAKVLVLEDKAGTRGVLVTTDLIGFSAQIATPLREQVAAKTKATANSVIVSSSHTHTGPTLSLDRTPQEVKSPADAERTAAYTRELCDKIVDTAAEAAIKLQPAKLSWSSGVVHFVMNRREFTTDRGVILGVNPRGLADRSVPILRIDDPSGKLVGVVCGVACHNTTLGAQDYEISGDYAGHAQRLIEEQHPGAHALFVLGCAGDANPYPRGTHEISLTHGKELAREVERVLTTKLAPVRGPLRAAFGEASLPLATPPARDQLEKLAAGKSGAMPWVAQQMLARLNRGEKLPTHYT